MKRNYIIGILLFTYLNSNTMEKSGTAVLQKNRSRSHESPSNGSCIPNRTNLLSKLNRHKRDSTEFANGKNKLEHYSFTTRNLLDLCHKKNKKTQVEK